ncbi:MAG: HlyC/CorC family transporter [Magnetovibrio sp.]|nr:HlyC/CorC family transporter [Magnetovibrio sp.]
MLATVAFIAFLLILSAFFSGSETALTAASRPLMHQLEQSGDAKAALVNRLRDDQERLIGAILIGNNLVNIMASAMATGVLIALFGTAGIAYATIAMTALVLVFAEILPKTYAIRTADRTALTIAPAINVVVTLFAPLTIAINALVRGALFLVGVRTRADDQGGSTEEELRGAIDLHDGDDTAIKHERAMLRSVLDLDDVQVLEIMTHRKDVLALDASLPVAEIIQQAVDSPYTRVPLWRDDPDNIVGVLHAKALLRELWARGGDPSGLKILEEGSEPWFIPEQTPLLDQLEAFRERREHFALVVDEYGSFQGVVTLEDILEEIVGEIDDEHDVAVTGVNRADDGSYVVDGKVTIRDLNRLCEWRLPDGEAATIAGLVLHEARRIPDVGQRFIFHGFLFDIVERQRNQITQVRITPPAADFDDDGAAEAPDNGGGGTA